MKITKRDRILEADIEALLGKNRMGHQLREVSDWPIYVAI
jgi:hypothetical protein